ncbi:phospholipase [Hymenobacter sp. H14-R3]|uniref:alpha/beta hydrolase n=1 Tax=Hymenobacter sp. H14-R3 TaxID=3046308 RepID=UPI0024B95C25|nr:phospholipase [Hymenobacter sp. H14-R3]MDJ0365961.1 phospholipase [Hymenobacter sp. H14-R3]
MEHHISVARTARYQQLGEASPATRRLWIVLHGYGQLAEYFIRHFRPLHAADVAGTVVVAPEALSRFYLRGTDGRIGASWMTRADRLAELHDQCAYLTAILNPLLAAAPDAEVTVLGFSQGTATASRWLVHVASTQGWCPRRLVLWAGDFPADTLPAANLLPGLPVDVVCGDADEYLSPEQIQQQADTLQAHGAIVRTFGFAGGHALHGPLLHELAG